MTEEKTYLQMRREFQELFFKKISPGLSIYENQRKWKLFWSYFAYVIAAIITVAFLMVLLSDVNSIRGRDIQIIIFPFAVAIGISQWLKKNFENSIKEKIMPFVCKCYGNLEWQPSVCSSEELIVESNIINAYDDVEYDDNFIGKYKDVNYEICEAEYTRSTGCGRNRDTKTIFKGVIVKLDMNKNFKGKTVIRPDTLLHSSPSSMLKRTELEDSEFEKKFDVFTDDEVEARYLITPSFMERLNNMKVAFGAKKVSCAFYDKYLLVGLHTNKDLFSLCSLFKPVNDGKQFFTMYEEILSIIKLIDHFKLDQKIGL